MNNDLIKIEQAIIVEGKYDKIKLSSIVDAVIIETDGFAIFKDKEKQKLIQNLAKTKGIIVLTDSDSAGFIIRSFVGGSVEQSNVTHVYIPDIFGKEKRKDNPSKEGKLGVEGIPVDLIKEAFEKAGVTYSKTATKSKEITSADFFEDGISGGKNSKALRNELLKELDLPLRLSTNSLLKLINIFVTYDEYKKLVRQCKYNLSIKKDSAE